MSPQTFHIAELEKKLSEREAIIAVYLDCLQKMDYYFGHGIPEVPDHSCSNPDSPCDMLCVDYSRYTDDLIKFRNVLQSPDHEASELLERVKKLEEVYRLALEMRGQWADQNIEGFWYRVEKIEEALKALKEKS